MSWKTHDYQCDACGHAEIVMLRRDEDTLPQPCPECDGVMLRIFSAPAVFNHAHRDGVRRFDHLRRKQEYSKQLSDAKQRGDTETQRKLKKEYKQ